MTCNSNSFFPLFFNLTEKNILLVGGGKIATDKLSKLLIFTKNIKIVAKELSLDIKELIDKYNLSYEMREYKVEDLESIDLAIVAIDDISLQEKIYHDSRDKKVLVNIVDKKELCDVVFGSFIKEDDLIISISTSGNSPAISKHLKLFLKKALPKGLTEFLRKMKKLRETLPKGKERMKLLDKEAKEFFT